MELIETIKERKSIRKFKSDKIEKKIIEDIIYYGTLAPSAKNRQPWQFLVIDNIEIKEKIANIMIKYEIDNNITGSSVKETARAMKEAPVLILIFKEKNDKRLVGDCLSIGACAQNMVLRAVDLGISSLLIRDFIDVEYEIKKILNKEELELNYAISLGYQDQYPDRRPRKNINEIIEWY